MALSRIRHFIQLAINLNHTQFDVCHFNNDKSLDIIMANYTASSLVLFFGV